MVLQSDPQYSFDLRLFFEGVLALGWCIVLFFSLAGWGKLFAWRLRIADPGIALSASLGMVFACLLGGLLNLASLIYISVLLAIVAVGLVLLAVPFSAQTTSSGGSMSHLLWTGAKPGQRVLTAGIAILILLHLFTFIRPDFYNPWDDFRAYLLLPSKMLQVHHLAADPFSQRRVINSVGFNYFLQDLFLAAAPLKNLTLVDGGLGIMLLVAASAGISRTLALARKQALWFVILAGLTVQIVSNLSFNWLPCGIYLTLVLVAMREDLQARPTLQAAALGAMAGLASGLKNNHITCSALFVVIFYGMLALRPDTPAFPGDASPMRRIALFTRFVAVAFVAALIVLLPWMIDLHHYSGTFFFPILGHGYEYTTYHLLPTRAANSSRTIAKCVLAGAPILALALLQAFWFRWTRLTIALIAFSAACGVSVVAVGLATGGDSIRRYTYPQTIAALLLLLPAVTALYRQRPNLKWPGLAQGAVICIILLSFLSGQWSVNDGFASRENMVKFFVADLRASILNAPLSPPPVVAEYHAVQQALPVGATVLEYVSYPYLFDDTRNTIYEASLPAMASPPPAPGWPILSDGEALGQWLVAHQVRYLIYSYGDEALDNTKTLPEEMANPKITAIMLATKLAILKSVAQIMELSKTRRRIYDDGNIFVLDLESPARP